jgi:hypothetical protein
MQNYIPKINPEEICETNKLCWLRIDKNNQTMVFVKTLNDGVKTIPLTEIADLDIYMWLLLVRSYASGHVFISDDHRQVYLTKVEKYEKFQRQFTGWVPDDDRLANIFIKQDNGKYRINLEMAEDNADMQTRLRTWAEVVWSYNEFPIVDWIMNEIEDKSGKKFWRLTLLLHYVVKEYKWELSYNNYGNVTGAKRRDISELNQNHIWANVIPVVNRALEIISL